jgi:hypothetical protein
MSPLFTILSDFKTYDNAFSCTERCYVENMPIPSWHGYCKILSPNESENVTA